jgi:hypothetical protein
MNSDGSNSWGLTIGRVGDFSWGPGGKEVLQFRFGDRNCMDGTPWIVNVETNQRTQPTCEGTKKKALVY